MAYTDFTLESAEAELGVTARPGVLFPGLQPVPVPAWLKDLLARGMRLALISEKARSEFIVAPILLAVRELSGEQVAILSGQRLDVDPGRRLLGECDFLLALSDPVPRLRVPLLTVVEAKKNDIEAGLGQCVAQMVGVQLYNERSGQALPAVYGCVTTGEDWQFLSLVGTAVTINQGRLYIDNVGGILATLQACVQQVMPAPKQPLQPTGPA
ncbi:MAG: hypothetical protein L0Z62_41600 [Gemmataceae bacterium]|nr:hypothetical protein [Gemmataceae bacterium]